MIVRGDLLNTSEEVYSQHSVVIFITVIASLYVLYDARTRRNVWGRSLFSQRLLLLNFTFHGRHLKFIMIEFCGWFLLEEGNEIRRL